MKLLNSIKSIIDKPEGYKNQFVENEFPNLLLVDPVMSRFDYYNIIFPSVCLHFNAWNPKCNIAFTSLRKFSDSEPDKQLTNFEIKWANVIVFPFSLKDFNYENKHLFDEIREINPEVKIIFVYEAFHQHPKFSQQLVNDYNSTFKTKLDSLQQKKLINFVANGITEKIQKADRVIFSSQKYLDVISKLNLNDDLVYLKPYNSKEIIIDGLNDIIYSENEKFEFLDQNETRVIIHCINPSKKEIQNFVENVMSKCNDNIVFYSQFDIPGANKLEKSTVTHFYKMLHKYSFDYSVFIGDCNVYDIGAKYIDGLIIDTLLMKSIPVFLNKKFNQLTSITDYEVLNTKSFVELLNSDYQTRFDLNVSYKEKVDNHLFTEQTVTYFENIFIKF
jgi:hypothetical protein